MRILCIVDCYLPSTKSSAGLIHDLAVEFYRRGHQVAVVTQDDSLETPSRTMEMDGVTVLQIHAGKIKGAGLVMRGIREATLSTTMWRRGKDFFRANHFDLIVFYSPSIFFGSLVRRLKKLYSCPAYLILRDIFPQWALDAGVLRRGLIYRYFRRVELRQYAVADVIGVQSPANLEYFTGPAVPTKHQLEVLFNWISPQEQTPAVGLRKRLGLEGKVVFFYGGNIGVAQDMDNIVRLAEGLSCEPDIYFLLVGAGSEVPRLKALIAEKGLTNIAIYPAVAHEKYLGLVGEFDVGLISLDRRLKTHNFPGKMLGYMYHGMPMLASINADNDLKETIERGEAGLVCLNGEDDKFREYAFRLAHDDQLRRRLGQNSRALMENMFSVTRAVNQIFSHFAVN